MNRGIKYDDAHDPHKVRVSLVILLAFCIFGSICAGLFIVSGGSVGSVVVTQPASVATATESTSSNPFSVINDLFTKTADAVSNTAATNTTLNYGYGISMGDSLLWLPPATLNAELDDIASLHIGWIRLDMSWNDMQPKSATSYNWTQMDGIIAAANARGIHVLPILDYTPSWARSAACVSTPKCEPADPAVYAAYAKAAATRYAPLGVTSWEIWNEENSSSFWKPAPDPVFYTVMLKDTYAAIKSVSPNATVIVGGFSPAVTRGGRIAPIDFLTAMYTAGAKGSFDALGFHPYTYPFLPTYNQSWNSWTQMAQTTPSLLSIMTANGDGAKKIWMTEFGAPTGGPGAVATSTTYAPPGTDHVTEAVQAQILQSAVQQHNADSWAGPLFWYSYKDLGTAPTTNENFFGIIRYDGSHKPAYSLFSQLIAP